MSSSVARAPDLAAAVPGRGTLAAVLLGRIAFGYQVQTVASLGPDLVTLFGIDLAYLGTLIGLYMLPGVAAAIPCGFLARRIGDRATLASGLGLMTVGAVLCALATGPGGIGAGRVVAGLGAVALTVMQGKVVADRFRGTGFTHAMGLIVSGFPIGVGFAQFTQGPLAHAHGWQTAFLAGGIVSGLALAMFLITWRPLPRSTDVRRALSWPSRHECVLVLLAGAIWTAYNSGYINFLSYLPTYLAVHGHSTGEANLVMTLATWGNLPSIMLGSAIAARLGRDVVMVFGTIACVIAVGGGFFLDVPVLWAALFGLLASVHAGIIVAVGTLAARAENRAVSMALFYTTYYVGGFILPPLCGRAADLAGDPGGAFLCAAILSAAALPLYLAQQRAARRSARPA